ncbi:MAG: SGNH/GDSL hydrolase family protein [Muribaculaceae bacterium]|nr:SGNH/GDSL hydrolase family protein [Muribaculaceae bacterium]
MNPLLKKLLTLALASMYSLSMNAESDWANLQRYDADNQRIINNPEKIENLVVFIGNSITDNWASLRPQFFSDNNFIGRGISGQTTYQFLVRFRSDVVALNPKAVVINGGINDIAQNNYIYNEDTTFGNIVSMAEIAKANGIKVILTSLLPSNSCYWRLDIKEVADKVASLNARIKEYAQQQGYPYIDYYSQMISQPDRGIISAYSNDGVHPTIEGYIIMEQIAKPIIEQTLKNK